MHIKIFYSIFANLSLISVQYFFRKFVNILSYYSLFVLILNIQFISF